MHKRHWRAARVSCLLLGLLPEQQHLALRTFFHGVPLAQTLTASFVSRRSAAGRSFRLDVQAAAKKSVADLSKADLEGKTVFVSPICSK